MCVSFCRGVEGAKGEQVNIQRGIVVVGGWVCETTMSGSRLEGRFGASVSAGECRGASGEWNRAMTC